jgi:hypothetical protein
VCSARGTKHTASHNPRSPAAGNKERRGLSVGCEIPSAQHIIIAALVTSHTVMQVAVNGAQHFINISIA